MKEAILYKKQKNGMVKCLACAHKCVIANDKTGICGVRKNINGKLFLLVYGKIVAKHVDPIEKKPLYHFLPNTWTFSIGTIGCNFRCDFCQNFDISQMREKILGETITPEQIVNEAIKSHCKSISYTYNEPTIFIEFVKEVAMLAKESGLKNIMVTNGYMSKEAFDFVSEYIDAMNIDLKGDNNFYKKTCKATLKPVLQTIKRCKKAGIHIEVTTLLIPGENDSKKQIEDIAKFLAKLDKGKGKNKTTPWHISRFFPMYKMDEKEPTPLESLKTAEAIGKKYLNHVHVGNV